MNVQKEGRTRRFHFRATDDEAALLDRLAANAGLTRTQYIAYLIDREAKAAQAFQGEGTDVVDGPTYVCPEEDIRLLLWHLNHWGSNLNEAVAAISKLARQESPSGPKATSTLMAATSEVAKCARAADGIGQAVERMHAARHIVLKD